MSECELEHARNLGPASAKMLTSVGITSLDQLRKLGAAVAFVAVQQSGQRPSHNLLWAMHGALCETAWNEIDDRTKQKLLGEVQRLLTSSKME